MFTTPANPGTPSLLYALFNNVHNIGTAYLTIRLAHYFAEIRRGHLPAQRRSRLNFLAYVCYAPSLIQGPIERFAPFQDEMDACHLRRGWHNVTPALSRMGLGVFKSVIATLYLNRVLRETYGFGGDNLLLEDPNRLGAAWLLYIGALLPITTLYLEFSGYCDVSAGMARLLGYRQHENFRRPWLATSMRDMWRRWHLTLSFILRDYVYIPLGGNRRHVTLNLCITFFVCGMWHEARAQVGIWGIIMGLMVAANARWVKWMKRVDETPTGWIPTLRRGWLRLYPLPQICAWLVTQHAFVWSLLVLFGGWAIITVPLALFHMITRG
jgi:alginate O-acetyltransferase complex protein AlgI